MEEVNLQIHLREETLSFVRFANAVLRHLISTCAHSIQDVVLATVAMVTAAMASMWMDGLVELAERAVRIIYYV